MYFLLFTKLTSPSEPLIVTKQYICFVQRKIMLLRKWQFFGLLDQLSLLPWNMEHIRPEILEWIIRWTF